MAVAAVAAAAILDVGGVLVGGTVHERSSPLVIRACRAWLARGVGQLHRA